MTIWSKVAIILISLISPVILVSTGPLHSLSYYWTTAYQPLFIISNIVTAHYMFPLQKWKAPAVLLLLLTAFSVETHHDVHNICAIAFFLSCIHPIYYVGRFRWFLPIYLSSAVFLYWSILWAELAAISALSTYHIVFILHARRVLIKRQKELENM